MNFFSSFVPSEFKPFLKYISPDAFKVVDWKSALKSSTAMTKAFVTGQNKEILQDHLKAMLNKQIHFGKANMALVESQNRSHHGQLILLIYFAQLKSDKGCFLDLRENSFTVDGDKLFWEPKNLQHQFSQDFLDGLRLVYKGYYHNLDEDINAGLLKMNLINSEMSQSQQNEIKALLLKHIGGENPENMKFEMSKFERSFADFFKLLKDRKMKLSEDFLFLGVYLVLLYACLEKLDIKLNVKEAYLNA